MASAQEMLLARVELVEAHIASEKCSEAEKEVLIPKLQQMRAALEDLNKLYETRLAEVQERNKQALSNLEKLSARVERRASAAAAEKDAAEARKLAEAEAEAEAEKQAKVAPKAKKSKKSPRGKKNTQLLANDFDTALLMGAVQTTYSYPTYVAPTPVLETPFVFPTVPAFMPVTTEEVEKEESPYVPMSTPECWDDHANVGSMFMGQALSAC